MKEWISRKLAIKKQALTMLQVDQIDISGDGNLLHFAVTKDLKEHVRILLEHGLVLFLSIMEV